MLPLSLVLFTSSVFPFTIRFLMINRSLVFSVVISQGCQKDILIDFHDFPFDGIASLTLALALTLAGRGLLSLLLVLGRSIHRFRGCLLHGSDWCCLD